ncbi:MAG TPA: hypothetical protein VJK05_00685, partial [archaeon]|nr:hypothetical protein [archaeon]
FIESTNINPLACFSGEEAVSTKKHSLFSKQTLEVLSFEMHPDKKKKREKRKIKINEINTFKDNTC